jgi:pimeloyl-ACP methyl ester carboxylesterase
MVFALKHLERIEKIVFTAPAFGNQPNSEGERLRDMGKLIAQVGMEKFLDAAAIRQRDELGWSPETIAYVRANFSSHQALSLATAMQTVEAWTPFADVSVFSRITCPVLILAWEQDPLHPYELAERYVKVFPNATLQKIPPLPAIFLNPPLVGQAYREFLEQGTGMSS